MIYVVYLTDRGSPATGLSPSFDVFVKTADGSSAAPAPAIEEMEGGAYKFSYSPAVDIFGRIDANDAALDDRDRYVPILLTPYDDLAARLYSAAASGYKAQTRIEVMTAGQLNQAIIRGDTPTFSFTVTDSAGDPLDLTEFDVYLAAKAAVDDVEYLFNKACTVTNAGEGLCEVELDADDTSEVGQYQAELELVGKGNSTGKTYTVSRFSLTIRQDVRV